MTKDAIRHKVWTRVTAAGVVRFPGAFGRIPNFIGAERAARLLTQLTIWKRAKVVKFDLAAPQLPLRRAALSEGKIIYIPIPGLRAERCFLEVDPARIGANPWRAASLRGALKYGRAVAPHELHPIDVVLAGSVAVSRQGARVSRGNGSSDLEYALLRRAGKVREYTPIVTTVHPLQVIDDRIAMRIRQLAAAVEQRAVDVDGDQPDHQNSSSTPTDGMSGAMPSNSPVASKVRRLTDGSWKRTLSRLSTLIASRNSVRRLRSHVNVRFRRASSRV